MTFLPTPMLIAAIVYAQKNRYKRGSPAAASHKSRQKGEGDGETAGPGQPRKIAAYRDRPGGRAGDAGARARAGRVAIGDQAHRLHRHVRPEPLLRARRRTRRG